MNIVGERLKELRMEARYSQKQIAEMCETTQATIGRYETGVAEPPLQKLLWYANFFDVSLDYIFGRTDNPKGMLYHQNKEILKSTLTDKGDLEQFAEMCFSPGTKFNDKLKDTIIQLLREVKRE